MLSLYSLIFRLVPGLHILITGFGSFLGTGGA